jgi:hypothetical protein
VQEGTIVNGAYEMLAMAPVAVWVGRMRAGVPMTIDAHYLIAESARSTIRADAQVRRSANDQQATLITRLRALRAQRSCEQREFRAWLQMTREPLW